MPGHISSPPPRKELPRVRFWRLRRNPLRRRSDLVQAWIGIGLLLAALAATPLAVLLAGGAAYSYYSRVAQHQAASRHHTTAVLLEDARDRPERGTAEARKTHYSTKVRFTDTRGHTRTSTVDVRPALSKGTSIRIWTDTDGNVTDPPLSSGAIRSRSVGSALVAALGVHATAAAGYALTSRIIHRRHLAAWETSWAETAPRWTTWP
ncbi:hypothetical protein ACFWII_23040 [Streptomyces sp. NPDC127063]|jgi:hypothetical protein|uniref:Rv1733c family protein n=1 Tax=Streptomyces sp. NPDC127063 TaxID=3347123 RepID=UPI003660ADB2